MRYNARDLATCIDLALWDALMLSQRGADGLEIYNHTINICKRLAKLQSIPWKRVLDTAADKTDCKVDPELWDKVSHPYLKVFEVMQT